MQRELTQILTGFRFRRLADQRAKYTLIVITARRITTLTNSSKALAGYAAKGVFHHAPGRTRAVRVADAAVMGESRVVKDRKD